MLNGFVEEHFASVLFACVYHRQKPSGKLEEETKSRLDWFLISEEGRKWKHMKPFLCDFGNEEAFGVMLVVKFDEQQR